jgi:hypothetical protein
MPEMREHERSAANFCCSGKDIEKKLRRGKINGAKAKVIEHD